MTGLCRLAGVHRAESRLCPRAVREVPPGSVVGGRGDAGAVPAVDAAGRTGRGAGRRPSGRCRSRRSVGAVNLAQSIRRYGHLAARLDPLGVRPPIGDPSLLAGDPRHHRRRSPGSCRRTSSPVRSTASRPCTTRSRRSAGSTARRPATTTRTCSSRTSATGCGTRPSAAGSARRPIRSIPVKLLDRLTQVEAFERFLHRTFPGKTRFSIEGLDMLVPILDEVIAESAEAGIASDPDRHGASRPVERDGARAQQAVRADPRRVQGSGLVATSARTWRGPATSSTTPARTARSRAARRWTWSSRCRRIRATSRRSIRSSRGWRARRARSVDGAGRAEVRSRAQRADPDSRRRGVPRPGRRRRDAEPEPAARLPHRRHDPHHRQQPARVHDRARGRRTARRTRAGSRAASRSRSST